MIFEYITTDIVNRYAKKVVIIMGKKEILIKKKS